MTATAVYLISFIFGATFTLFGKYVDSVPIGMFGVLIGTFGFLGLTGL